MRSEYKLAEVKRDVTVDSSEFLFFGDSKKPFHITVPAMPEVLGLLR
jgi:hypothetical protein